MRQSNICINRAYIVFSNIKNQNRPVVLNVLVFFNIPSNPEMMSESGSSQNQRKRRVNHRDSSQLFFPHVLFCCWTIHARAYRQQHVLASIYTKFGACVCWMDVCTYLCIVFAMVGYVQTGRTCRRCFRSSRVNNTQRGVMSLIWRLTIRGRIP